VVSFNWHPKLNKIVIHQIEGDLSSVLIYDLAMTKHEILDKREEVNFSKITWSGSGNAIAYFEQSGEEQILHHFRFKTDSTKIQHVVLKSNLLQARISHRNLWISEKGAHVFFYRELLGTADGTIADVEIWDSKKSWIYPRMRSYVKEEQSYLLTYWDVASNQWHEIADEETPTSWFNPEHTKAFVFNKLLYEPEYLQFPNTDVYVRDFQTGKKELVVEKISIEPGYFSFSPSGRYVSFFKNGHWWVYDTLSRKKQNVTQGLKASFENKKLYGAEEGVPYGCPGWTQDEKHLIIYDSYDIWLVGLNRDDRQKITSGKERGISYRLQLDDSAYLRSRHTTGTTFNLNERLLLTMKGDDLKNGYALWTKSLGIEEIVYDSSLIEEGNMSIDGKLLVFKKSKFNEPPSIHGVALGKPNVTLLYQSNAVLKTMDLGSEEILYYNVNSEEGVKAMLIYPSEFDANKTYPLIAWIYENNSAEVNRFSPPSNAGTMGFNILDYVLDGYFVLLPDISYRIGAPGMSALHSITSAMKVVLNNKAIDKTRLGLIGHSFGGYETSFIVTQTDLFSVAVAGAAVSDLMSSYHDVAWDWNMNQMWRFEKQQFRMGATYYSSKEAYLKNSPLYYVEHIQTPLLLWTGKQDGNANWYQSIYLFMGMKRLNKEARLILFEKEGHFLIEKENQMFLALETKKWFDRFLK
ncbi:MAG TPA: prolyl oligopeptidase family serine peptidase, partial [Marinilabiliaceae bacterium]|nr:prolyl oligopeptidase family serine peptidase [Marinilabiliaceae bacterium]